MTSLTTEAREFLMSFKNSERMSPQLRAALTVETGLAGAIATALKAGVQVIFITGSAGSGKTHLIHQLEDQLERKYVIATRETRTPRDKHILIIRDATELTPQECVDLISTKVPTSRVAALVGINEGPLREAARLDQGGTFTRARTRLHDARLGDPGIYDPEVPLVIDVGGYDPIEDRTINKLLDLKVIRNLVVDVHGADSQAAEAWRWLETDEVRARVAEIVRVSLLVQQDWNFRDLWDLVSDLAIGGDDSPSHDDIPRKAWFWRLFYGDSRISTAIREVLNPLHIAIPVVDARLWYGDWHAVERTLMPGAKLSVGGSPGSRDVFAFHKIQALLLTREKPMFGRFLAQGEPTLQRAVADRKVEPLIEAINTYMTYGYVPAKAAALWIFSDHGVERRTDRRRGQIRLLSVSHEEFEVRTSAAVANYPGKSNVFGTQRYLYHARSRAALRLTAEKLRLLQRGRSPRTSAREDTDLDYDLHEFFRRIYSSKNKERERMALCAFTCDFDSATGRFSRFDLSHSARLIEEVGE